MKTSSKKRRSAQDGFTVVEMMLAGFLGALVIIVVASLFKPAADFYQRTRLRHQLTTDARTTLETIIRTMRNGKASSLTIGSYDATVVYSSATFTALDGSAYEIYQATNTVHL